MRSAIVLGLALVAFSVGGCKGLLKKREPDPSASQVPAAPALPVATPAPAPVEPPKTPSDDGIPTPEDFEDEAFEKVTAATYTTELERLKKDIGK
jgi:hypothetical protein